MIEKTKQLVESKYTVENGYGANAKVRGYPTCCPEMGLGLLGDIRGLALFSPLPPSHTNPSPGGVW